MEHREFKKDMEFWMSGAKWRVTDIGTRTVIAIKLDQEDSRNYNGPPYSIVEHVIDEYDQPACAIDRADSNG